MKKFISIAAVLFTCLFCFAEKYQIVDINYNISPCAWKFLGSTKPYCLEQNVSVNTTTVFESEEELLTYIEDYKQRLYNLRAFELIDISTEKIQDSKENSYSVDDSITKIKFNVKLVDSMHLLAVPYMKYDSNSGFIFKLKAKDTNFLGTLNPMGTDINILLEQASENSSMSYKVAANFDYDYPFKAGIFDAVWVNNYGISYTFGDALPEWDAKTGLKFSYPVNESVSTSLELYQSSINDYDYEQYGDNIYFVEEAKISTPVIVYTIENFSDITWSPYLDFTYNWDFNHISNKNYDYTLEGPDLTFGHSLSLGRSNWENDLRTGLTTKISNTYSWNFNRNMLYPFLSMETTAFKSFNIYDGNWFSRFGICSDIYIFNYFINNSNKYSIYDGINIGDRLRGIRDNQYYSSLGTEACKTPTAVVVNLDLPIHIYTSNFTNKYLKYFNFDLQISPFVDFALIYNKATNKLFDFKDGFYAAGLEVLVYPLKFSSYTVRASVGYDIGRAFFSKYLNTDWRSDVSKFEISLGLGLHY